MSTLDWVIDGIFYMDIVMNFWTGYDTGYMIVKKKGKIARNYITTRFPVDLIATVVSGDAVCSVCTCRRLIDLWVEALATWQF